MLKPKPIVLSLPIRWYATCGVTSHHALARARFTSARAFSRVASTARRSGRFWRASPRSASRSSVSSRKPNSPTTSKASATASGPTAALSAILAASMACRASPASRSNAKRWICRRTNSSCEMSPFSARTRWIRSTSSRVLRFSAASARVASATRTSVNAFWTWKTTCRWTSASSCVVTRVAACALSILRRRLPPVSINWPRVMMCCGSAVRPPSWSAL